MHIVLGNSYDYPQYYDIAFQRDTSIEADFVEAAYRKYCRCQVNRLLEPACGSGRLLTEFAARGYKVTGFDLKPSALSYLRRRLSRRRLHAEIFEADMADFRLQHAVDAAYCTASTFRHLLTEQRARSHLECMAASLRAGGIYILGFRLLPPNGGKQWKRCWMERRWDTEVTATLRAMDIDLRSRMQNLRLSLRVRRGAKEFRLRHEFQVRTYTAKQFRVLLDSVPSLELSDIYDLRYNIEQPLTIHDEMAYGLFILRKPHGRR